MEISFEQVEEMMLGLVEGRISRDDAADWAMRLIRDGAAESVGPKLWQALDRLAGADLQQGPGSYLHHDEDFRAWLAELRNDRDIH